MHGDTKVIADIGQLDAAWLDAVLRRTGAMGDGRLATIAVAPARGDNAHLATIRLRYAPGSTGTLPARLLLKMCATTDTAAGSSEVEYYTRDYAALDEAPIPTCYDAAYSAQHRRYHVLMDDLSSTHVANWSTAPGLAYGYAVADALAALHAYRWGEEPLRRIGADAQGAEVIDRYLTHVLPGLRPMLAIGARDLGPEWVSMLATVVEQHPRLLYERVRRPEGFTLIHGNVNPGHVLSPVDGAGRTYLIDRHPCDWSLAVWLGVADLAYLMVHWWDTTQRRTHELPVLRRYHDGLSRRGVTGYTWDQLLYDYRLSAVQSIYVIMEWCVAADTRRAMKWVWLPHLRRAMTAFVDLHGEELWA